ncbi:hypothetical protein ABZ707_20815 [Streptomyces sp. NPDC006923]
MAAAIHVRNLLTYTFPLVIDGFIAIGVGALVLLRTAPLPARLYVWALVGAATATSVWANALHAIRLNQQTPGTGLHLGDTTVAVLSAIAPLALAGATHLHILIARSASPQPSRTPAYGTSAPVPYGQRSDRTPADVLHQEPNPRSGRDDPNAGPQTPTPADFPRNQYEDDPGAATEEPDKDSVRRGGRPPMATVERLAEVIAAAHPNPDEITRDSARKALTEVDLGAGTLRLTEAINLVRTATQARQHPDQPEDKHPLAPTGPDPARTAKPHSNR